MIIDRTAQDWENAKIIRNTRVKTFDFLENPLTQAEIDTLERGAITKNTLNRIENKQAELKELLNNAGYWNTPITNKTWTGNDWQYAEEWQRVLNNLDVLKQAYFTYADTPATPDTRLDYINLNAVEKILEDLQHMINIMKSFYRECGTFQCGEE